MQYEQNGTSIRYDTPEGDIRASTAGRLTGIKLSFAVHPIGAHNRVELRYRLNGVVQPPRPASLKKTDAHTNTQHFVAAVPDLRVGDRFEYVGVVTWPGGQAPSAAEASTFPSSFKVVAAGAKSGDKSAVKSSSGETPPNKPSASSSAAASRTASGATTDKSSSSSDSQSSSAAHSGTGASDSELTALLAASPAITGAVRTRFISLYNANHRFMAEFWEQLTKDPELGPAVPQLQLVLQLGTLTLNNPQLVAKLLGQFHPSSLRDLTKLDSAQLIKIITDGKIQVPAKIGAATTPETIAKYADSIHSALQEAFPTDSVAKALGASTDTKHQAIAGFLAKSADFDLEKEKIDTYLAAHPSALKELKKDEASDFTDRLKATQRLSRVTKDGEAIRKLMEHGLDSAYKIAATPRGAFLDQHADALGGQDAAAQIHANATSISAVTSHIIHQARENAAPGTPRMIASGNGDASKTLDANIPNWQTLFGSSSTCQCTECRAIDGPAAYFVSLLQFLEKIGRNTEHPPLDVLLDRRPDLANLKLNCANADTALPYVDLVNEILESYVAHHKLSSSTAHDTPADATPQALSVNPEYLQTPDAIKAYETLNSSSAVYPFTLPFDRDLETMRTYLSFLGVSRHQLLKEFGLPRPENDAASPRLAAEYLEISEAEYVLITNHDFSGSSNLPKNVLFKYFGYSANDATWQKKSLIEQVPEFLSRTGLVYTELLELLETHYLNPGQTIALELANCTDVCDITAMRIGNVADLLPPLPAFLRLRKKLGWKIAELDYALRAFGVTSGPVKADDPRPIPADFLLIAAQLKQLQKTLNLSVDQTVSLWHDINTDGRGSHYNSLFQNKAVINPPDPAFGLLYQAPLASLPTALPEHWSDGAAQNLPVYDTDTNQLQLFGSMADKQRDDLLKWAGDSEDAIAAVQSLYSQRWYEGIEIGGYQNSASLSPASKLTSAPPATPVSRPTSSVAAATGGGGSVISMPRRELPASRAHTVTAAPKPSSTAPPLAADSIANHIHAILAALRISSADLVAILEDAGYCDPQSGVWVPAPLTLSTLSMVHRYALLARSSGLSLPDLIALKNLTGLQPFTTALSAAGPETDPMVQFVAAARQVQGSQFTIAQLAYLYGSDTGFAESLAPLLSAMDSVVSTMLTGLQNIAAANAFAPDSTGAAVRKKLGALLPSASQLNAIMSLIGGSTIYISPLAALPSGLVLPAGQVSFVTAATIGGTISAQDSLTLTVVASALTGSPIAVSYTVQATDTPSTIAAGLAAQINSNTALVAAGISAIVSGAVVGLSASPSLSPSPVWTASESAGASETVTLAGSLFCTGPMSDATAIALINLTSDLGFNTAIRDLYNQAQDLLIQNLGIPAYFAALPAWPAGLSLPPGQVSFVPAAIIGGMVTANDSLSLTMTSSAVTGSPLTVSYAVQPADTANTIAAALASQINSNPALVAAGISAMAFGAAIGLSSPPVLKPPPVWTAGTSPSASETVNMGAGLVCYGAMSKSTKAALLSLSNNSGFSAAVDTLYEQAGGSNQDVGSVIASLIRTLPGSTPADRYNSFLQQFLSYLTNTQSRNLVKQSLAEALNLDAGIVQLLVDGNAGLGLPRGLLRSSADPEETAINDFLGGLSAAYYNSAAPDPAQVPTVRIDPGVNLDGTQSTFGSAEWTGKLLAPTTGSYTFSVPVSSPSQSGGAAPQIALTIDGQTVNLVSPGGGSGSANAINLTAGQLYTISLVVSGVPASATVQLQWCVSPAPAGTFVTIPALAFTPCATDGSYPTLALLYRIGVLITGFSMKPAELASLSTHPSDFAGVDPETGNSVPFSLAGLVSASDPPALFNQWQRLNALYSLKAILPAGNISLFDIFAAALASPLTATVPSPAGSFNSGQAAAYCLGSATPTSVTPASPIRPLVQMIATATGWNQSDILALTGSGGFNLPDSDFRNELPLIQLSSCLAICFRIGVSAQKLLEWANPANSSLSTHSIAQDIQHTTKAKYDDAGWLTVGKPLNDKLRESSKEALITYVLQMPHMRRFIDGNDLYGYFLIDVEMCSCMETSRIVQASAAVQLFVQRCLLNLENDVKPSAFTPEDVSEWNQWRKEYRLWQAAVEVLLYPENWIVPELRPDKTPFFSDLETKLLQSDVNAGNVETAYLAYLESLQQVARLEIAGVYSDFDPEAGTELTHVVARTFTHPHVYFYRTLDNSSYAWSAWEKIDAEISGDSLIPVVWNRRLFLFWPVYTEATDPNQNNPPASSLNSNNSNYTVPQSTPPIKTLQIQLASTEYKNGKWTPKQVTIESLVPAGYASYSSTLDTTSFVFTAISLQDSLSVTAFSTLYLPEKDAPAVSLLVDMLMNNASTAFNSANNKNPPGASDIAPVATSLQALIAALGQLQLVHVPRNNASFVSFQQSAALLSSLTQAMNNGSPSKSTINNWFSKAFADFTHALGSFSTQIKGPIRIPVGSFFFDGSQGSVEIQELKTSDPSINVFPKAADHYGSSDGKAVVQYSGQQLSLQNSGFDLLFAAPSAPKPVPVLACADTIPKIDGSFPQQTLPAYTFDVAQRTGEKIAFFADRRRTHFVVQSSPLPKSPLRNSNKAFPPQSVPAESIYVFNHHHPWVGEFIKRLNWKGIAYLLDPSTQALASKFDTSHYRPSHFVAKPYPEEAVDFGSPSPGLQKPAREGGDNTSVTPPGDSAYSIYNWEIFFHIPLFIATSLTRNQKFADAQTWFHYIFNPTQDPRRRGVPSGYKRDVPNGYWNFQPLNLLPKDGGLQELLDSVSGRNGTENAELDAQVQAWTHAPFEPDVIARLRPAAYQKTVVMRYLDNLIKWGDYLFAQNTRESIYESTQLYILADQILGRKPTIIPEIGTFKDLTYEELAKDDINQLGNAQVQLENAFPLTIAGKVPTKGATGSSVLGTTVQTPYFCTPPNSTLLQYYDTVADRLYKIRHCMNIEGQVEQLPLFAPPINPGLLVAAEAAGVDLSSVLNDIGATVPHYRFTYMLSKALELCAEVRSLGGALLSACEKYDAEGMALLRAGQELSVVRAVRQLKQMQIEEANDNLLGLQATLAVTTARQTYYQGLVSGGLSVYEIAQVGALGVSEIFKLISLVPEIGAGATATIPQVKIGINGAFGSPSVQVEIGGEQASRAETSASKVFNIIAEISSFVATMAGMIGGWERRAAEWGFQLQTATLELAQIQRQISAAEVRVKIATQDLANQELQITNATAVQDALRSKFTNKQLYSWMVGQVSALFFQCYQMAYDLAKRAEVCYRFELGIQQSSYIQFGYWDSLKKGLLAGERLFKDLKRLEGAYLDQNKREYEITKSISLLLLDPFALITLKLTGACLINLPEAYFDMDYPGHYMRRIKTVSLTIPCVAGPYTSVNCTLTLLQSKIRVDSRVASASSYPEKPIGPDGHFYYNFAATESIATSTAQNDSGTFEVNFRDERYLPFEGSGVISQWQLSMPPDCNAFDFETITDVILNLRYTARDGGDALRAAAKSAVVLPPAPAQPIPQSGPQSPRQANWRGFSLRHEYPTEWYKFLQPVAAGANPVASMQINLSNDRFPFQYRGKHIAITKADLFVVFNDSTTGALQTFSLAAPAPPNSAPSLVPLSPLNGLGNAPHFSTSKPPAPSSATQGGPNSWILQYAGDLSQLAVTDMFLVCEFSAS